MEIKINLRHKGVTYESLVPGDVFSDQPLAGGSIYMKPASDDEYAISLRGGVFIHFDDEEVVYPLNATLVINEE